MKNIYYLFLVTLICTSCQPTVKIEAPDKPIVINLNIEHNIKVQIDKDLDDLINSEEGLF